MKLLAKLALLALLTYSLPKWIHPKTDGFKIANIYSNRPNEPRFEIDPLPVRAELEKALCPPYTYLSAGGQCYAFVSADGKTVLKLFKHHLRRVHPLMAALPLPQKYAIKRAAHKASREKKLLRDYSSYKLAFERLKEATGLLYVQLNKKIKQPLPIEIIDKIGVCHTIDLSEVEFVLQKRAELAFDYLEKCENSLVAREAIRSLCRLIATRYQEGIYDEDAKIHRNFGFVGEKAMIIDVGRLKMDQRALSADQLYHDLKKSTDPLRKWLLGHHPELVETLDMTLEGYDPKTTL